VSTLLIHFISDFLRDQASAPNQFGETLRCAVMENEITATQNYGLSQVQINILIKRDRAKILERLSEEIGAFGDEVDGTAPNLALLYPAGGVHIRKCKLLFSNGNNRTVEIRGVGFEAASPVEFAPQGGGPVIQGAITRRSCDADLWQRLYVTATLPAASYGVTVKKAGGAQDNAVLDVP